VRLNEIEAEYKGQVTVEWRSYLLRPEPEPRPMEKFTDYTKSWERPAGLEPRASFNAWSGENQPPSHSLPSAIAGKVAAAQGPEAYRAFSDQVFKAYFTENRTISDRDVLTAIAVEAGLDGDVFTGHWDANAETLEHDVMVDYLSAVKSEITGVPAVVVNRSWVIPGAVETDEYRSIISQAQEQLGLA
jgi:predicted DsbA family dithiol-disulfide isomerase